jgi:uncharacterized membrane protein YfcA
MSPAVAAALFGAGLLGGAANAIAGGGTFFTFPVLLAAGLPPVVATASNAVAIWPGHAFGALGYRREIRGLGRRVPSSGAVALMGGALGAWLLIRLGDAVLRPLIPWLLLVATLLFAFSGPLRARLGAARGAALPGAVVAFEFTVALYGGYFGAGLGVLMMAALLLTGMTDMQQVNGLKNVLATLVTGVSLVVFLSASAVAWPQTLAVMAGAVAGGLIGAAVARHVSAVWLQRTVSVVGLTLSVYYFVRIYL